MPDELLLLLSVFVDYGVKLLVSINCIADSEDDFNSFYFL